MDAREMFDLTGRMALVTGGTGLYGAPISEALAESGAHVIIASRDNKRCEEWVAKMLARGLKASAEQFDQSSEESILALGERVLSRWAKLDVLINNSVARTMYSYGDDLSAWKESMDVNATGLFAISRVFLDSMMKRGSGAIINVGSIQGVVAPDFNNYAGSNKTTPPDYQYHKHGLVGLTKYLAAFAGPRGVRVNAISPGGYDPSSEEPFISQYCGRVFLGRMAESDDIKGVIVFLASEASRYITGQNIIVDGGYTC
jgi:NAD(P)-dependent dehydrogenase (short-subunit alcohol dehydrogenase family)